MHLRGRRDERIAVRRGAGHVPAGGKHGHPSIHRERRALKRLGHAGQPTPHVPARVMVPPFHPTYADLQLEQRDRADPSPASRLLG